MNDRKIKVGRRVVGPTISLAVGLLVMQPVSAHNSLHSEKQNSASGETNAEVCHLDADGEYDLIKMPLDMAFDHLEHNDGHVLAIDGQCSQAK